MSAETKDRDLQEIGKSAYESIQDMIAALECDYERLAELKEERANLQAAADDTLLDDLHDTGTAEERKAAAKALQEWDAENGEELAELVAAAGECESREDAEQRIQEDPLSVEVRSGWVTLGETMEAEEFNILLSTGGPAVRIRGELGQYNQPDRAWLEVQDWYTPWTQYFDAEQSVLLTYCQQFYFGE